MLKECKNCLLPSQVPGSDVDAHGLCRFCREFDASAEKKAEERRQKYEADFEETLRHHRGKGKEYDCLVSFSGGKDSIYLLHRIVKEYGLRTLAYTLDFDLPPVAWDNIRRTMNTLSVDHLIYTPSKEFYKRMTRYLLMNQRSTGAVESVCRNWAFLRDSGILRLAYDRQIPLILIGYSPGQPVPYPLEYELPPAMISDQDWTPQELVDAGLFSTAELEGFWNPARLPKSGSFPRFLAPFRAWKYDQGAIMKKVLELGLVQNTRNANPVFTNFSMNWLFIYSDLINLGYNPYAPEFARLVREGKADGAKWKRWGFLVEQMIRHRLFLGKNVTKSLEWLDLKPSDLKITRS